MGIKRKSYPKIVTILGPTASGKSDLAVSLAKKFNGEVISADSRQVYKGMDIGSGKITKKEMQGVTHHLLDVASPKRNFSASRFQKLADKAVQQINKRKNLPIICGGTAFYIKVITQGVVIPSVKPDWSLRKKLEKKSTEQLFSELKKKDSQRAKNIDNRNRRRLIRALEIILKKNAPVPPKKIKQKYDNLFIGIQVDQEKLNKKIDARLKLRLDEGMAREVQKLRNNGLSWKRLESFGLEYKWMSLYLQKKITLKEAQEKLLIDIKKFSKKQMNWWRHDPEINWIKSEKEAFTLIKKFINN